MFKRVYIEITNLCNLRCSFCPGTRRSGKVMSTAEFALAAERLRPHAAYFYLHVMGEPLLHPQLGEILEICRQLSARVCLTTNGLLLAETSPCLLSAPALHKVSVSLHSMEGNGRMAEDSYLEQVWTFAHSASRQGIICALRLWNLGGADRQNGRILSFLAEKTGMPLPSWPKAGNGSWRLGDKLYLEQAERFDWPDLTAPPSNARFCLALREQAAVLADGTVVPCCLDHEGDIPLGNIFTQSLQDILDSPRARALYNGFSRRCPSEELCRRCGYASRF